MSPITLVRGADDIGSSLRLRGQLRGRGLPCVVLVEMDVEGGVDADVVPEDPEALVAACVALAAAGMSSVVHVQPERAPSLLSDLQRALPRVVLADPSLAATLDDCQARGWLPPPDEVYTAEELEAVTARLHELGYA